MALTTIVQHLNLSIFRTGAISYLFQEVGDLVIIPFKFDMTSLVSGHRIVQISVHDVNVGEYLIDKYALWLDFRTIDENVLHRTGRKIRNALDGINLQIEKKTESAGNLYAYVYLTTDAQLNIQNGMYVSTWY